MTNKFQQFLARVKDTGIARSAHFFIELTPPAFMDTSRYDVETVNLYCQQAQIPEMVLQTTQINDDGLERQVVVGKAYGRAAMVFVCDQDMLVRKFFEDWVQNVVVSKGGVLAYPSEYTVPEVSVNQVNMARDVVYTSTMHDVFPVVVADLPLSTESRGLHMVQVQFVYRYWDSSAAKTSNLSNVPDNIRNFISSSKSATALPPEVPQLAKMNSSMSNRASIYSNTTAGSGSDATSVQPSSGSGGTDSSNTVVGQDVAVLGDSGSTYNFSASGASGDSGAGGGVVNNGNAQSANGSDGVAVGQDVAVLSGTTYQFT